MKLGITGLKGSGKNTLFEAFTGLSHDSSAYKGEDRIGTVKVPDERVDFLSNMYQPKKTTYAQVQFFLPFTKSLSGNQNKDENVWSQIRNCDAIINVVRNFKAYGEKDPEPLKDFESLDQEFILSDLIIVEKRLERIAQDRQRGKKNIPEEISLLNQCQKYLNDNIPLRTDKSLQEAQLLKGFAFLSLKPVLILFNNEDDDMELPSINEAIKKENFMVIRGKLEQELAQMPEEDINEFLLEFDISESAMNRIIKASYDMSGLISFFTVGDDEVKAWTIKNNTNAQDAAGTIHTDFKKGFIRAEVLAYKDLLEAQTYNEARKKGSVRLEGKTYIVNDGDIINFRFNV